MMEEPHTTPNMVKKLFMWHILVILWNCVKPCNIKKHDTCKEKAIKIVKGNEIIIFLLFAKWELEVRSLDCVKNKALGCS